MESVRTQAIAQISELFKPKFGTLGRSITRSDIMCAVKVPHGVRKGSAVDYCVLQEPTFDLNTNDRIAYYYLENLIVNAVYSDRTEVTFRG